MHLYPKNIQSDLEFDFVIKTILNLSVTRGGQLKIKQLQPMVAVAEIEHQLKLVNEFLAVYQTKSNFPSMAIAPIKEELGLLRIKNAVLSAEQILNLKLLVEIYNQLHRFIKSNVELLPLAQELIAEPQPNKIIPTEIDKVLDHHGIIKSSASKELMHIRISIDKARQAANRIFERALKKYSKLNILADFSESIQEDRRVLAVNAAYKNQLNGIIHGSSAKNSLVFIEPGECLEVNNQLDSLKDDERKEIRRILMLLTRTLAQDRSFFRAIEKQIAEIDFIHAKSVYAYKIGATLPKLAAQPKVNMQHGLNPVLLHYNKQQKKETVPLDITLDQERKITVISGPNAGGKSITLKTVGLLQLMVQSGILVPVHPNSEFGVFQKIMVDIGDAQSIENELSTYSSKLQKMRHFLEHADDNSMVLIDEFGSGSDPDLGGALAQVFLEKLSSFGTFGIYTTHYNVIKALASRLPKVQNASMLFNRQTFKPEFKLNQGIPGSSYTFEVALKSGIPKHIVNQAKEHLGKPEIETDQLLVKIQDEKIKLTRARKELFNKVQELEGLKANQEETIQKLEEKLNKQALVNEEMSTILMWGKRFEGLVKRWMHDSSQKNKKTLIGNFVKMMKERESEAKAQTEIKETRASRFKKAKLEMQLAEEILVGDKVRLLSNKKYGIVQEIRRNKYLLSLGANITVLATRDQFVKA